MFIQLVAFFSFSILPIILGLVSLQRIKMSPNGMLRGRFFAYAAICLGTFWFFAFPFMSYQYLKSSRVRTNLEDRKLKVEVLTESEATQIEVNPGERLRPGVDAGSTNKDAFKAPSVAPHYPDRSDF